MPALTEHADVWLEGLERSLARAAVAARLFGDRTPPPRLGAYEIARQLGYGGSGVVFEACHIDSGQRVALKVLRQWTPRAIVRLKREFRTLGDIHHDNLVQLHELNLDDEAPFITMELIEGGSLRAFVCREPKASGERLLSGAAQLVDAVSSLHAAGVLHRDLKPSNLRVEPSGRLVVLDFGLARPDGKRGLRLVSDESGTLQYIAPERLRDAHSCPAGDWFSAGTILTELLPWVLLHDAGADARLSALGPLCRRLLSLDPRARPEAPELRRFFGFAPQPLEPVRPRRGGRPRESAVFDGRTVELRRLHAALGQAAAGRCVIVHVVGAPGIGKSALVDHYLQRCAVGLQAPTVLAGRCHERELIRYNALDGAIEQLACTLASAPSPARKLAPEAKRELGRQFPALGSALALDAASRDSAAPVDLERARMLAFEALGSLIQALAERRPLVLCLDDLQWGDAGSARALERLLSEPTLRGVLVIASYRADDAPHSAAVAALSEACVRGGHLEHRIELGPLSAPACLRIASTLARGGLPADTLAALSEQAAGSPLFLSLLVEHGRLLRQRAPLQTLTLPALLLLAIDQLPPECQALLQLAALAVRPVDARLLLWAARAYRPDADRIGHIARLQRSGWLRSVPLQAAGEGLLCFHDRLRETLVASLPPPQQQLGHAALADAAAELAQADHEFLAIHNHEAGRLGLAAGHAERAGDQAVAGLAMEHAVVLYARALQCMLGARPALLVEKLAQALADSGRCAAAAECFLEVAQGASGPWQHDLRMRAASMLLRVGLNEESAALLRPLLRSLGLRFPRSRYSALAATALNMLRIRLRGVDIGAPRRVAKDVEHQRIEACLDCADRLGITDPIRATPLMLRGFALALEHGSDAQLARGLAGYALMHASVGWGSSQCQDAWLAQAEQLAQHHDPTVRSWMRYYRAFVHSSRSEFRSWFDELEASRRLALINPPPDMNWRDVEYEIGCCSALALTGDIRALERRLGPVLRRAQERDNGWQTAALSASRALLSLARDQPDRADAVLDHLLQTWPRGASCQIIAMAILTKGAVALYRNQPQPARELLQRSDRLDLRLTLQRVHPFKGMGALMDGQLALAAFRQDPRRNLRSVAAALSTLSGLSTTYAAFAAEVLRACLALLHNRDAEADAHLERTAELADALGIIDGVAAARLRQSQLRRTELARDAATYYEDHGIVNPEKWARVLFPVAPDSVHWQSGVYCVASS